MWTSVGKRIAASFCVMTLGILSLTSWVPPLAQTSSAQAPSARRPAEQELTGAQGKDFRCVKRSATAKPPPRLAPRLKGEGKYEQRRGQPPSLKPLCPPGQVPVPVSTKTFRPKIDKGNPLIGPIKDTSEYEQNRGQFIRRSLRPFNEVYWKGRGDLKTNKHHATLLNPQAACAGVVNPTACYYYGSAAFRRTADGGGMTMSVERPKYVNTGGSGHTLDEIAVQGGPGDGHIVELGWNVSSDQYGNANPHIFVFHWNNWNPTCYDNCNWQQYSSTYSPGMDISGIIGRQVYIGYVFYQGNWWAWFDNQWLGYFPGSEWNGNYTKSELLQWFGEVASNNGVPPLTQMGNGLFPADPNAATMFTLCDVDAAAWVCWYRDQQVLGATATQYYDISRTGFGQTRYGGPGQ